MLNKKNDDLLIELFKNPTSEYRGAPFWAWNSALDKKTLEEQIEYFYQMGFGGFFMHPRTGLKTLYLSDEYIDRLKDCVEKAKEKNMYANLYDEDRWPSGYAGGFVTEEVRYRDKVLIMTRNKPDNCLSKEEALEKGFRYMLAAYDVKTNANGEILSYERISQDAKAENNKWYAYVQISENVAWYNDQAYTDILDKNAVRKFINLTHEKFKDRLSSDFGKTIPYIFSDEPEVGLNQFEIKFDMKIRLNNALSEQDVAIAWSTDFDDEFKAYKGYDILDYLPELILDLPNKMASKKRYDYFDCLSECFTSSYVDQIGAWCKENNIAFTGHLFGEDILSRQIIGIGESMRAYRSFTIPGMDVLCDYIILNCAKQVQSSVQQYGKEGALSELYGVTNWEFDFRKMKFQGDWQASLGITLRVPHLSWLSMKGEAKRDYPPTFNYQSSWYREYSYLENHYARLNTALTRGEPIVRIAVIHPVESAWLLQGPIKENCVEFDELENNFRLLTDWLLGNQLDFNFICESQLPLQCDKGGFPLKVGKMQYDAVLVANCKTLRSSTVERLKEFKKQGGRLIFAGECPTYVDVSDNRTVRELYVSSICVPFSENAVLSALDDIRLIRIHNQDKTPATNLIYNYRQDNNCRWLFIARKNRPDNDVVTEPQNIIIMVNGEFSPLLYDTLSGDIKDISYVVSNGKTFIYYSLHCHSSLLLRLNEPEQRSLNVCEKKYEAIKTIRITEPVKYKLSEPNVLLLDRAEYSINGGEFYPEEEILRADDNIRNILNIRSRKSEFPQPWSVDNENTESHIVTLRFKFYSSVTVMNALLAVENADNVKVSLNGSAVEKSIDGYYVDKDIKTIKLPKIIKGENVLCIEQLFNGNVDLEWCYILGDFSVKLKGCVASIEPKDELIGFASITEQGLPFYGGAITYETEIEIPDCSLKVDVAGYAGIALNVALDDRVEQKISFAPHTAVFDNLKAGKHKIAFTLFGHRGNSFGTVHLNNPCCEWISPEAWRKKGKAFCYEYKLKDIGVLSSPIFTIMKEQNL